MAGSKTWGPVREVSPPPPHPDSRSYFSPLLAVWKVTVSWEATGAETLPRIRVFWPLKTERKTAKGSFQKIFNEAVQTVTNSNNDDNTKGRSV